MRQKMLAKKQKVCYNIYIKIRKGNENYEFNYI